MTTESPYTPHPAKAFFAVFMSGAMLLGLMNMGRTGADPEMSRIVSGTNTGGVFLSSIIAASTVGWRFPIFAKVSLFHIAGAIVLGFLNSGSRGFAYALGSSLVFALMYAVPCWLMLSRDWLIGRIIFWGLVGMFALGFGMLLLG